MGEDVATLDRMSRELLGKLHRLRGLEGQKRHEGRSTPEFHHLAGEITDVARDVFDTAIREEVGGAEDSPIPEERADGSAGDWTSGNETDESKAG
jgi:hypothetical protein